MDVLELGRDMGGEVYPAAYSQHRPALASNSTPPGQHLPARNVTATLTYSVTSVTPHTRQYYSKLKSQLASSLESPSNLAGLSSFNYAAVLPTIACCGATYAVAIAVAITVAACTAVKAACHRPHTSATITLTFCGAVYVACVRASYKS